MSRIGILGGSFSPIHNGHLQIAQDCLDEYSLDKVIFLPNSRPPHRKIEFFSFKERVEMLEIAILNSENFEISMVESDSNKVHYSYNTIKENFYNNEDELFFIMGDDEFLNIKSWYRFDDLLKLCSIIVFSRNFDMDYVKGACRDILDKYAVYFVNNDVNSISSTEIRNRMNKKKSFQYMVNEGVYRYILSKGYFDYSRIKTHLLKMLPKKRYEHSIRVAEYCKKLAKIYNYDVDNAYLAGLVHDCAKNNEEYYILNMPIDSDIIFDMEEKVIPSLQHAPIGAIVAKKLYGIDNEEILSAIRYHTTAKEDMTMLEKILFISDKIEPCRNFQGVDELRKIAQSNIDLSIIKFLESNFEYLKKKGSIHSLSIKAKKYLENMR